MRGWRRQRRRAYIFRSRRTLSTASPQYPIERLIGSQVFPICFLSVIRMYCSGYPAPNNNFFVSAPLIPSQRVARCEVAF